MTPSPTISISGSLVRPLLLQGEELCLLDQRKLPLKVEYFQCQVLKDYEFAIKEMVARGAPLIGVVAAIGLATEAKRLVAISCDDEKFSADLDKARHLLQKSRPTAINLNWATNFIFAEITNALPQGRESAADLGLKRATELIDLDIADNLAIGAAGAPLLRGLKNILTHCNAGALATCGWGTALGVIRSAWAEGERFNVFVDETRPRLQGAKLTAWELLQDNIPATLISDNMAGHLMVKGLVDAVIVGADRIARNGDTANKIGTYSLSVLAKAHNIPMYVAAPISTFDMDCPDGKAIPIEERSGDEIRIVDGMRISPADMPVYNPSFDVSPVANISSFITNKGILKPPFRF